MNSLKSAVVKFVRDEEGVSAIEYAVLAVIITAAVVALGPTLKTMFTDIFTAVSTKVTGSI